MVLPVELAGNSQLLADSTILRIMIKIERLFFMMYGVSESVKLAIVETENRALLVVLRS
jgi:hypothetical protein